MTVFGQISTSCTKDRNVSFEIISLYAAHMVAKCIAKSLQALTACKSIFLAIILNRTSILEQNRGLVLLFSDRGARDI